MLKALIILIFFTLTLTDAFAWSPKTIEYRKSFDEVGKIEFTKKMNFNDFEVEDLNYVQLGQDYECFTNLLFKNKELGVLKAGSFEFELKRVITSSPYTYCKQLPDFEAITNNERSDKYQQGINLKYEDKTGRKISIMLYGKNRASIDDYETGKSYSGKITSHY